MFGYPCELDELRAICERHGLALIEDAAEALGAEYKGAPIGSHGPSGVFGFYPNKQLATGEGGVVFTHSERGVAAAREPAQPGSRRTTAAPGSTTCGSAGTTAGPTCRRRSGSASSRSSTGSWRCAREAAARYGRAARGRRGVEPLCADDADHKRSWFVYVVALPAGVDRDRVMAELRAQGIGTAEYVPCVHLQPYMRETLRLRGGHVPGRRGDRLRATLALPFYPQLEAEDQERVVEALRGAL